MTREPPVVITDDGAAREVGLVDRIRSHELWLPLARLTQVCLVAAFATMGLRPLGDPDLGWHLRTGQFVLQHGFTTTDPWSFASTQPWVLHEWGGEVLMYMFYSAGG